MPVEMVKSPQGLPGFFVVFTGHEKEERSVEVHFLEPWPFYSILRE